MRVNKLTRYLGLDYGSRRIGVAVSDPFNNFSQSLETISRKPGESLEKSLNRIREIVDYYKVDVFVLGLPLKMNNEIGEFAEEVIKFKKILEKTFGLPVNLCDERRSSAVAENILISADVSRAKRKNVIDKMAAGVILQRFLDVDYKLLQRKEVCNERGCEE